MTATLRISLFPNDGENLDTLMRHADLAVYRGKKRGRNTTVFFTPDLNDAVQTRLAPSEDIRRGLDRG